MPNDPLATRRGGAQRLESPRSTRPAGSRKSAERKNGSKRLRRGFTIIELFVALAIMGILAAVSVPNLTQLVHRSRRAEAYTALRAIHDAQAYHDSLFQVYAESFDQLGFELDGGERLADGSIRGRHYTFTLQALSLNGKDRANFRATAAGDIDHADPVLDILVIENQLTVEAQAPGGEDRMVDANEAVLVSDDIANRTRTVVSASDAGDAADDAASGSGPTGGSSGGGSGAGAGSGPGDGTSGGPSADEPTPGSGSRGSDAGDRGRSGRGDGTHPGRGRGRENAPGGGGSNPGAAPSGRDGADEARPAPGRSARERARDARGERERRSRPERPRPVRPRGRLRGR